MKERQGEQAPAHSRSATSDDRHDPAPGSEDVGNGTIPRTYRRRDAVAFKSIQSVDSEVRGLIAAAHFTISFLRQARISATAARTRPVRRHVLEPCLHGRGLHRCHDGGVQGADDGLGGAFREKMANHVLAVKSGRPCSAALASVGKIGARFRPSMAMAFTLFFSICGMAIVTTGQK